MKFQKGNSGRPKGAIGKTTATAREMFGLFVEANLPKMQGWIEQIAEKDPEKALALMLQASEYHVPKLARTELTGKDGKDLLPKVLVLKKE